MKKTRIIFISILVIMLILFLVAMILLSTSDERARRSKIRNTEKDAGEVDKKKDFSNIDVDKYLKLYASKDASAILIGRSDCEFCKVAETILHGVAYDYDLNIYYLSVDGFSDEDKNKLLNSDKYFQESGGVLHPVY